MKERKMKGNKDLRITMDFLQRNLFTKLRSENFGTQEELEAMTTFKKKKIAQMMKNLNNVPSGEVLMHNSFLNRRLTKIQKEEPHVIDTSMETVYLLRLIVSNANAMLSGGISIRGIIQLGQYLRTRGDKVDFVKLDNWLTKLHLQRMAQLEGSVLITFFNFEQDEIPFVKLVERGAYKLTLRSLYYNIKDMEDIKFQQSQVGFVHTTGGSMRKNLRRSMRFFGYAPIESASNFFNGFFRSLSEIEE